ncbi:MAG: hypothetical protein K0R12_347 [Gammaproteobacteria bacterium]|jgi:uncharacterized protein YxeA|nr:hypothetical protein [Gammaproteobacteria bacterium]
MVNDTSKQTKKVMIGVLIVAVVVAIAYGISWYKERPDNFTHPFVNNMSETDTPAASSVKDKA